LKIGTPNRVHGTTRIEISPTEGCASRNLRLKVFVDSLERVADTSAKMGRSTTFIEQAERRSHKLTGFMNFGCGRDRIRPRFGR
jgi:hypothetical protein